MISLISTTSLTVKADPVSDCKSVIKACDETIAGKDRIIELYRNEISESQKYLGSYMAEINEKDRQLASPFKNPYIMFGGGALAGVLTVVLLTVLQK